MKPCPEYSYTIEARLSELLSPLIPMTIDGGYLSVEECRSMVDELEHIQIEAIAMRNELSQKRYRSRADDMELSNLVHQQAREGNVVLFPSCELLLPRKCCSKGRQS